MIWIGCFWRRLVSRSVGDLVRDCEGTTLEQIINQRRRWYMGGFLLFSRGKD